MPNDYNAARIAAGMPRRCRFSHFFAGQGNADAHASKIRMGVLVCVFSGWSCMYFVAILPICAGVTLSGGQLGGTDIIAISTPSDSPVM
jgi:hypothetical protein